MRLAGQLVEHYGRKPSHLVSNELAVIEWPAYSF